MSLLGRGERGEGCQGQMILPVRRSVFFSYLEPSHYSKNLFSLFSPHNMHTAPCILGEAPISIKLFHNFRLHHGFPCNYLYSPIVVFVAVLGTTYWNIKQRKVSSTMGRITYLSSASNISWKQRNIEFEFARSTIGQTGCQHQVANVRWLV